MRSRRVVYWVLVVALVSGGFGVWAFYRLQTYHLATVVPGVLYRDGNRGLREFANACDRVHPRSVVSLIDDRELNDPAKPQFRAEATYLHDHGIHQIRIPVSVGGWPTADDVGRFLKVVADPADQPVLVHCAQGVRRTGMFVAAYEMSERGQTARQTEADIRPFGHTGRTLDDIRTFITGYDPVTCRPTSRPATGVE